MNWTHDQLMSFPTEDITSSSQIGTTEVLRSGDSRMFLYISVKDKIIDITDGYWSSGKRLDPIKEWSDTTIFDINKPTIHGWKRVLVGVEYDPKQQPYTDEDI